MSLADTLRQVFNAKLVLENIVLIWTSRIIAAGRKSLKQTYELQASFQTMLCLISYVDFFQEGLCL